MLPTLRTIWDSPLDVFTREFDRALGRDAAATGYPVDIREDGDTIVVEAELPGFTKDQIEVTTENGVLTISAGHDTGLAEKAEKTEKAEGKVHLSERSFRKVTRSFRFPDSVELSNISANLTDGVLTLRLPKREEVKPRKIEVK